MDFAQVLATKYSLLPITIKQKRFGATRCLRFAPTLFIIESQ
jgi:hypothetical protein